MQHMGGYIAPGALTGECVIKSYRTSESYIEIDVQLCVIINQYKGLYWEHGRIKLTSKLQIMN